MSAGFTDGPNPDTEDNGDPDDYAVEGDLIVKDQRPPALTLMPDFSDSSQIDGNLQVFWCAAPWVLEELRETGVIEPYLLIDVYRTFEPKSSGWTAPPERVKRYLVPMSDGHAMIQFNWPGKNIVRAKVVYQENGGSHSLKMKYLHGSSRSEHESVTHVFEDWSDEFDMEVPDEIFAREPPEWLRAYLGKFFSSKPANSCAKFWRYGLVLLMPVALTLSLLIKLIVEVFLLVYGSRTNNVKALWHPLQYGFTDVGRGFEKWDSYWYYGKDGIYDERPFYWWFLSPPVTVVLSVGFFGLGLELWGKDEGPGHAALSTFAGLPIWQYVLWALAVQVAAVMLVFLFWGAGIVIGAVGDRFISADSALRKSRKDKRRDSVQQELQDLICAQQAKDQTPTVEEMRAAMRKRSFHYRVYRFKGTHCKPVRGG